MRSECTSTSQSISSECTASSQSIRSECTTSSQSISSECTTSSQSIHSECTSSSQWISSDAITNGTWGLFYQHKFRIWCAPCIHSSTGCLWSFDSACCIVRFEPQDTQAIMILEHITRVEGCARRVTELQDELILIVPIRNDASCNWLVHPRSSPDENLAQKR